MSARPAHSNQIDMLHGSLLDKIFVFAMPFAAGNILQQMFNSVDVAVVGHFASSQAQAAVGCNGAIINLLLNLFIGASVGANVIIANYIGRGETERIEAAVHTAMKVALFAGVFLLVTGQLIARPVLTLMNTPADVLDYAVIYFRIYFLGMPFVIIYNFGSAILRSIGDTRRPLYCLIASGFLNVVLNLFLVIVCNLGVAGVAIATAVANVLNASVIWCILTHEKSAVRMDPRKLTISGKELRMILRVGIPAGVQSMVFSVANVFIQSVLNGYGAFAVAGSVAALNFESYVYMVFGAFAQAAVTFTSQNYGARQYDRCGKTYRLSLLSCLLIAGCMSFVFLFGSDFFISLFTKDPQVAAYGITRMRTVLTFICIAGVYEVTNGVLRGLGHSTEPAVITVFGTCVLRLIWIYTVCRRFTSFETLMIVYPVSWLITTMITLVYYLFVRKQLAKEYRMKQEEKSE